MKYFTLPQGETVPVDEIPKEIVDESRRISRFYNYKDYFLDHEGHWRLNTGEKLRRYHPAQDRRRTGYIASRKELRPIMPATDARKNRGKTRASRNDKAERARMGVTEAQSEYIDRYILTGGRDTRGLTHAQLCHDLGVSEATARSWVTRNQSFQAEAHRRVGNDVGNPINLQRMWDVLLRSANGELEGQEGPNPVDAKAALGLMEKAGFLTPPTKDDTAPDMYPVLRLSWAG